MALCTSDEVATETVQDLCLRLMQVGRDDRWTCKSHITYHNVSQQSIISPGIYTSIINQQHKLSITHVCDNTVFTITG